MNIAERLFPKWAYKREAWRQGLEVLRNYDAARKDRYAQNWHASNESAEMTDKYYRSTIRARSRDLERNSDFMSAVLSAHMRSVIGSGYDLQSQCENKEFAKEAEALFSEWCKKENCDVSKTQSFSEIIQMCYRRKKVDGGILILKVYTNDGIIPFKLQCLEVDELDELQTVPKHKGNKVVGGIEYNGYNAAVGYWINEYDITGYRMNKSRYIEAKDIIFYFTKTRPSQIREMPEMANVLTRIRDINGFVEALSVKERITACLSVFIKKAIPNGFGRTAEVHNAKYDGTMLSPGMIKELQPGEEIQAVNPSSQSINGESFIKTMLRMISSGSGLSYETVSRDMSEVNYSSARQAAIDDELSAQYEITSLKQNVLSEIYESFVISAVLHGKLKAMDFWKRKEYYLRHIWIQPPKKWIDPYKEALANKIAMETWQKSLKQVCAETGRDVDEVLEEIAHVKKYAVDLGLIADMKGGDENGTKKRVYTFVGN